MTIFLCGFMGCGKSTIGKKLAAVTDRNFIDMDEYIENKAGLSIPEIFSEKGEEHFRELETKAVKALGKTNAVIACGGGAMLKKINADEAKKNGKVIYLELPFEICYERIRDDRNRPIVMNNTKDTLREIYNNRISLYENNSDIKINADSTPQSIAEEIKKLIS